MSTMLYSKKAGCFSLFAKPDRTNTFEISAL